jgi:hypothetical protein
VGQEDVQYGPRLSKETRGCGGLRYKVKNYVFTRGVPQSASPAGVEFVNEPIKTFCNPSAEDKGERHLDDGWRWHHFVVS